MIKVDHLTKGVFRVELTDRDFKVLKEAASIGGISYELTLETWLEFVVFNYKHLHSIERNQDGLD